MQPAYLLSIILVIMLGLFIWGHWRHDVIAAIALLAATLCHLVPFSQVFSGLSSPAVVTVGLVMVITQTISRTNLLETCNSYLKRFADRPGLYNFILCSITGFFSAFMNNIGALALTMPLAIHSSIKAQRSPSLILIPLAISSVLGGLTTAIGTPPNILISNYRQQMLGTPYSMFSFTHVGLPLAVVGILVVTLVGWRWLPARRKALDKSESLFQIEDYIAELKIPAESLIVGKTVTEVESLVKSEVVILGIIRKKTRYFMVPPHRRLLAGDILLIEAGHQQLDELIHVAKLDLIGDKNALASTLLQSEDIILAEAVVSPGSRMEGRSVQQLRLRSRYNINLIAIAREGKSFRQRISDVRLRAGDVVLCQGSADEIQATLVRLGGLPLSGRGVQVGRRPASTGLTLGLFALGIALSMLHIVPIQIGFGVTVLCYVLLKLLPVRTIYETVDWSILIMLAMLLPLGHALETSGITTNLAQLFVDMTGSWSPYLMLGLLFLITMTLSDVMNNVATAVVMAPVAAGVAHGLHAHLDPFLMTIAVSASCSFLTPISHQNNMLVMGPGEYKFFDYLRIGIPLEIIIILIAIPLIVFAWPL